MVMMLMLSARYREGLANGEDLASLKVSDENNSQHYRPARKQHHGKAGGASAAGGGGEEGEDEPVKEFKFDNGSGTQKTDR
jgi:hypothetical protein